jgi:hypothetical protein
MNAATLASLLAQVLQLINLASKRLSELQALHANGGPTDEQLRTLMDRIAAQNATIQSAR